MIIELFSQSFNKNKTNAFDVVKMIKNDRLFVEQIRDFKYIYIYILSADCSFIDGRGEREILIVEALLFLLHSVNLKFFTLVFFCFFFSSRCNCRFQCKMKRKKSACRPMTPTKKNNNHRIEQLHLSK